MIHEAACMALALCAVAWGVIGCNRLGLFNSWWLCGAAAFTFVLFVNIASHLPVVVSLCLVAGFTPLLRWVRLA